MTKVERNDPCPCGSGLKYKKCCGTKKTPKFTATQLNSPTSTQGTHSISSRFFQKMPVTPPAPNPEPKSEENKSVEDPIESN